MPLDEDRRRELRPGTVANAAQARLVDAVDGGPLVVVGGLPPDGRDLDVLAADADVPALAAALAEAGFEARGVEWVRFAGFRARAVDVIGASTFGPPAAAVGGLVERSLPLAGYRRLRRPAPADVLLLLASRGLGRGGGLAEKHRRRIADALAEDPGAWATASARAGEWGAGRALETLRAAQATAASPRASRRGAVVALSGIDGSGKSTQAEALAQALEDLGHDAVVAWSRITYDPALRRIGAAPKRVLAWLRGARAAPAPADPDDYVRGPGDHAATALRERYALLDHAWTLIVIVVHALSQRRALAPHLRAGRVVVRDRYVLDATVQLEEVYGRRRDVRLQAHVLRLLCPTPAAAFWLDVDPGEAYRRKPEEYDAAELAAHRARYASAYRALGVRRVDAGRPEAEVAAELARETWRRLG